MFNGAPLLMLRFPPVSPLLQVRGYRRLSVCFAGWAQANRRSQSHKILFSLQCKRNETIDGIWLMSQSCLEIYSASAFSKFVWITSLRKKRKRGKFQFQAKTVTRQAAKSGCSQCKMPSSCQLQSSHTSLKRFQAQRHTSAQFCWLKLHRKGICVPVLTELLQHLVETLRDGRVRTGGKHSSIVFFCPSVTDQHAFLFVPLVLN